MGATFSGEFTGTDGKNYKVTVTTASGSGTKELKFSGSPFTTSCKSDGKNIYAPMKTSGATIGLLVNGVPDFDLYTGEATGNKVVFTDSDSGEVLWTGFVTPCAYDMPFDSAVEELEIECVDGLAVLKDIPYRTDSREILSFAKIIHKCLRQAGCYRYMYTNTNVQLSTSYGILPAVDKLQVSEQLFFDQKKDVNETDDDVAWSCYDVLKEIMQWLGYTMFADGQDVYIVDYDAIKAGNTRYYRWTVSGSILSTYSNATISYDYAISGNSYGKGGSTFALDDVYNKVTVKDKFYTYDSLFPEFGDITYETDITPSADSGLTTSLVSNNDHYLVADVLVDDDGENYIIFVAKNYKNRVFAIIMKYYTSPCFDFKVYSTTSARADVSASFIADAKYSTMMARHGAFYVRMYKKELERSEYDLWRASTTINFTTASVADRKAAWLRLFNSDPTKITLTPQILMLNLDSYHIGPGNYSRDGSYTVTDNEHCRLFPYIVMKNGDDASAVFGGSGNYLVIKGTFSSHDEVQTPWPMADGADNDSLKRAPDYKFNDQFFNWARLKWGDMYWNGSSWQNIACDFKLWFIKQDGDKTRVRDYYDKDFEVIDTASTNWAVSEKGYYVPAPTSGTLSGTAEFILYAPRDWWGRSNHDNWSAVNRYDRYYNYVQTLKNFSIKAYTPNGFLDADENESDTYYTNVIAEGSVSKMDDITFKVCTFDDKKNSYSTVVQTVSGVTSFVQKTYNKAMNNRELNSVSALDGARPLTQEEHLIFKLATQYSEPRVVYTCTLKNAGHKLYGKYTDLTLQGRTFVADSMEIDWRMNECKVKLIEKA